MTDSVTKDRHRRRSTDPVPDPSIATTLHIDRLLEYVIRAKASDLHLTPGIPPTARVDGELVVIPDTPVLTGEACSDLLDMIMTESQRRVFDAEWELDFAFGRRDLGRYRVNAFMQSGEVAVALRLIPQLPPSIEELGLPAILVDLSRLQRGLILVTGPAGSGKTTTLASMVGRINQERTEHVITIEDPVEYVHVHDRSIVQQREVGRDTTEFARALRSALREDPDVILIGEMRDLETIAAAVSAAETGHLVFATLHTNGAAQALDRIVDVFPPSQQTQIRMQLSGSIQAVIAQRLVPKSGGGRVCVCEVLIANEAVRNLIREGKTHQLDNAMQSGVKDGMIMFDTRLAELVRRGDVRREVALRYANDPRSLVARVSQGVV